MVPPHTVTLTEESGINGSPPLYSRTGINGCVISNLTRSDLSRQRWIWDFELSNLVSDWASATQLLDA
jgi:hypothetical protein